VYDWVLESYCCVGCCVLRFLLVVFLCCLVGMISVYGIGT